MTADRIMELWIRTGETGYWRFVVHPYTHDVEVRDFVPFAQVVWC